MDRKSEGEEKELDERRKLKTENKDYRWIHYRHIHDWTIREIATWDQISTKFAKKVLSNPIEVFEPNKEQHAWSGELFACSGCNRVFERLEVLTEHVEHWKSGGCWRVAPKQPMLVFTETNEKKRTLSP